MDRLSSSDIMALLLGLGTLLATARFLGEWAQRWNQPAVLGEMLAGILLGPTVLGSVAPRLMQSLFPEQGGAALALDGFSTLAIILFLLVAGIEVDLSTMWRQGKAAAAIGIAGTVFPFALGYSSAMLLPGVLGHSGNSDPQIFALFFATALSISALPVIAKTLMDLALYRSDLGMVVIGAAVFNDLVGAMIFAVILGMMGATGAAHGSSIAGTIWLTVGFTIGILTIGRWLINRTLPYLQAHTSWPGGVLAFALSLAIFGAAFTEWVGVHAIFGAFLVGVAIGDSPHLRERTRTIISDFVSFIFAPVFFASIGLRVNFVQAFDLPLVLLVLGVACVGKIVSCGLAARWSGMNVREAWAVGFGMNARGAIEIIFGLLALKFRLIDDRMFVALVVMALVTSIMSGPAMSWLLRLKRPRHLSDYLQPRTFVPALTATTREEAIRGLASAAAAGTRLEPEAVQEAVLLREQLMSTGMGNGLAIPHARVDSLTSPVLALGISRDGIDFDAPDGEPAHLVFLILTPVQDNSAQIEILADLARVFKNPEARRRALQVSNYTQFLAMLRTWEH
jgi:Kef-type K+ transport system membrane component KefB/mannitol/fructose-specific phosphotransferase system IIA component (Ntr-type)